MKYFIKITFILLFFVKFSYAQTGNFNSVIMLKSETSIFQKEKGAWKLDTIYGYTGQNSSWFWDYKEIVLTKNDDFYPLTIEAQARDLNATNWYKTYLLTNSYYSDNQIHEQEWVEWNTSTNSWNTQMSVYNKFDEQGKIVENFMRYWDNETQSFYMGNKEIYTYNLNGTVATLQNKDWDAYSNSWQNWSTVTYTYNEDNLLEHQIEITINGNYLQIFYTYDSENRLETVTEQVWWDGEWLNFSKETNSYNIDNQIETKLVENYDDNWYNSYLFSYTYNENGLLIEEEEHNYTDVYSSLLNIYTYDENGNETSYELSEWNGSSWSAFYKVIDNYDDNQNQTEFYSQAIENGSWVNFLKEEYIWNHYGTANIFEDEKYINLYPNPSENFVFIQLPEIQASINIEIFDINGKKIDGFRTKNSIEQINVNDYISGIYFVKIRGINISKTLKFLKE